MALQAPAISHHHTMLLCTQLCLVTTTLAMSSLQASRQTSHWDHKRKNRTTHVFPASLSCQLLCGIIMPRSLCFAVQDVEISSIWDERAYKGLLLQHLSPRDYTEAEDRVQYLKQADDNHNSLHRSIPLHILTDIKVASTLHPGHIILSH